MQQEKEAKYKDQKINKMTLLMKRQTIEVKKLKQK